MELIGGRRNPHPKGAQVCCEPSNSCEMQNRPRSVIKQCLKRV